MVGVAALAAAGMAGSSRRGVAGIKSSPPPGLGGDLPSGEALAGVLWLTPPTKATSCPARMTQQHRGRFPPLHRQAGRGHRRRPQTLGTICHRSGDRQRGTTKTLHGPTYHAVDRQRGTPKRRDVAQAHDGDRQRSTSAGTSRAIKGAHRHGSSKRKDAAHTSGGDRQCGTSAGKSQASDGVHRHGSSKSRHHGGWHHHSRSPRGANDTGPLLRPPPLPAATAAGRYRPPRPALRLVPAHQPRPTGTGATATRGIIATARATTAD